MSHFDDTQLLEISAREREQLTSANIVRGERLGVLTQLQRFQPTGHFRHAPTGNLFFGELGARRDAAAASETLPKGAATFAPESAFTILQKEKKL